MTVGPVKMIRELASKQKERLVEQEMNENGCSKPGDQYPNVQQSPDYSGSLLKSNALKGTASLKQNDCDIPCNKLIETIT